MGYLRLPSNVLVEESMYRRNKSSPKTTKEKKASVSNDVEEAHFHGDGAAAAEPEHRQRRVRWSWFVAAPLVACVLVSFFTLSRPPEQSLGWNNFEEDYHRRYRRAPPKSLEQWLTFALKNDCEPMRFYDVIERDLAIFRNQSLSYDKVVEEATKYTDYFAAYQVKDNRLSITNFQTIFDMTLGKRFETFNLQNSLSWLFRPLQNHKPPLDAKFVLNLRDQPTDKRNATYPIFSACHKSRFNDNLTYPETHATTRDDESITRDLLVPYYFSIGVQHRGLWFWPFYSRGPSWRQRKDSIVWRGSTTGLPWGDSPRFWLLEQYGAKGVHEIVPGVDADFAFVRVVQNYDGQALPEKYRRAEAISYRDIQQHKYVLDVDGNCKYLKEK